MENMLETHRLSKKFKRQYANYDISLSVKRFLVIMAKRIFVQQPEICRAAGAGKLIS